MDNYIGIFDSGVGGLTILEELKKILPNENFIYYKDTLNNPYGEKTEDEIYNICKKIVERLLRQKVKLIIIACNTATTICMKKLQEEYKQTIFVGTVPAIKVACDHNYKNILIMVTPATYHSKRLKELININKKEDQKIEVLPCHGLASAIEEKDNKKINKILNKLLISYQNKRIDAIVLGCTHYPLIKEKILKRIPNCKLIDSSLGVSKEVKRQLANNSLLNSKKKKQKIEIIYSKK